MAKAVYLPDAIEDLRLIWAYVAKDSQSFDVADRVIDTIDDDAKLYAKHPEMGPLAQTWQKSYGALRPASMLYFICPIETVSKLSKSSTGLGTSRCTSDAVQSDRAASPVTAEVCA